MRNLVQLKATTFYTRNSPTTGAILHGDPRDEADEIARFPQATEEDADYLEGEHLAERFDGSVPRGRRSGDAELDIHERGAAQVEENIEAENSVDQTTGLSTRDTTAFDKPIDQLAGRSGSGAPVLQAEGDEAPAGARSGRRAASDDSGDGQTPYRQMSKAELEAEAAKDPPVDISSAKNNDERADLIEKARGNKAPAKAQ